MTANTPTCDGCRFWELRDKVTAPPPSSGERGRCHIRAPRAQRDREGEYTEGYALFPVTWGDEWCGEHQPKVATDA